MNSFNCNSQTVLDYLSDNKVSASCYALHRTCYARLSKYFEKRGTGYSIEQALVWHHGLALSDKTRSKYAGAITRLDDVFRVGKVSFRNRPRIRLAEQYETIVSSYLIFASGLYSHEHLRNVRNRCRFFFYYLQLERQACPPDSIAYEDVIAFYKEALAGLCDPDFSMYKSSTMTLLAWMAGQGLCSPGLSILLKTNLAEKTVSLDVLPKKSLKIMMQLKKTSIRDFPADEFYTATNEFCKDLEDLGYKDTMMSTARTTLDLLYVFLDMNSFGYSPVIAREWFAAVSSSFGTNFKMSRRVLSLFESFTEEGAVHAENYYFYGKKMCDCLPDWCRNPLYLFLDLKKQEGKAGSTVDIYRSSCTRFCQFLTDAGLTSFGELNALHIKSFNLVDKHMTAEGKNAYNVRIRKFLLYLAEQGFVHNWFLGAALPCSAAPKVRVVHILTKNESDALEQYDCEPDRALALRNRAIILLGLKMGLRISDITSMKLSQIDWKTGSIRFCQEKTSVGKLLPMPVEVGNALFRYLTEGRPQAKSRHVFITHKAPYCRISRAVGSNIMKKVFPDKAKAQYGFHSTRRTYATERFRNNCSYSEVADLLGQSNTDTVHKYISLDEERMRLCPVSVIESGITMIGGFRRG